MSNIPPIDQVLRLLRAQPVMEKLAPQESRRTDRRDVPAGQRRGGEFEAADHVVRQVGQIARDDPQRRRRAFRTVLEGRLIELVGRDALNLPAFGTLLDQVHDTMSSSSEMTRAMDAVADQLLSAGSDTHAYERLTRAFKHGASSADAGASGTPRA